MHFAATFCKYQLVFESQNYTYYTNKYIYSEKVRHTDVPLLPQVLLLYKGDTFIRSFTVYLLDTLLPYFCFCSLYIVGRCLPLLRLCFTYVVMVYTAWYILQFHLPRVVFENENLKCTERGACFDLILRMFKVVLKESDFLNFLLCQTL